LRHSWLSGTRRVPVLAFAALALGATARADLATPLYVPVPVVAAVSTNITERFVAVVCSVSNTSAYARSGRVALYDILGAKLVESRYDLNPQATFQLTHTPPYNPSGLFTDGIRCRVVGDPSAGEAGIRASLCGLGGDFTKPAAATNSCVEAH
jgi:hypothetical protein